MRTDNAYPKATEYTYYVDDGATRNYTMYYDTATYTPLWVAYPMKAAYATGSTTLKGSWKASPAVATNEQVNVWSGSYGVSYGSDDLYARGHMIPNASRNGYSQEMIDQAYYATNSVPQIQNKFNGGIWQQLETAVRGEIDESSYELYVVTGAAFKTVGGNETITYITPQHDTEKSVPVANYFYKVVLKVKKSGDTVTSASTVGFWFEHKAYSGDSYTNYDVSVDEIEALTGFDFFANLPDGIENSAEQNSSWSTFQSF